MVKYVRSSASSGDLKPQKRGRRCFIFDKILIGVVALRAFGGVQFEPGISRFYAGQDHRSPALSTRLRLRQAYDQDHVVSTSLADGVSQLETVRFRDGQRPFDPLPC
jgi:hypothetical protein